MVMLTVGTLMELEPRLSADWSVESGPDGIRRQPRGRGTRVSHLASAVVAQLDDDTLAELAMRLAPFLPRSERPDHDGWLSTRQAARYLGVTPNALHKLTAARAIPFAQDTPGAKCWFRRSELDAWRRGELR